MFRAMSLSITDSAAVPGTVVGAPSGAETTSSLDRYLAEITDLVLRENLAREISGMQRQFGLVFERHHPEGIRLPKHTVKRGSKVVISTVNGKAVKDSAFYRVHKLNRDESTALLVDAEGNEAIHPIENLTVAKEFGDIGYPGLRKLSEIRNGEPDAPVHTVINGENYHALEALQYTHAGKVDMIYIDPPYNTGSDDWKYNDKYIDGNDGYRHSKWLSFMEKRLIIAKSLLKSTGVIFIHIGTDEHHRLRSLCDQVFGESNFITSISRVQKTGNDAGRFFSPTLDHILVVAKNKEAAGPFRAEPDAAYFSKFKEVEPDGSRYTTEGFYKSGLTSVRSPTNRYWVECPDGSFAIPPGNVLPPTVADGALIKPESEKDKVWRWSSATYLREKNNLVFKEVKSSPLVDEHGQRSKWNVYTKQYMDAEKGLLPRDLITEYTNTQATKDLGNLGFAGEFPYSKPVGLLEHLGRIFNKDDAVILDFFGGSGTTAEAVIRLNAEDGGTRQAILVTNNELSKADDIKLRRAGHKPGDDEYEALGVFHHVTKPRLETVVTGIRQDGSTYSNGLAANIAFFELTYLDEPEIVTGRAFNDLAGLFWLKAGGVGGTVELTPGAKADGFAISESGRTAVLFTPGRAKALAEKLNATEHAISHLFIVTDSEAQGDEAATHFPGGITVERIYGSYLEAFQVNRKD